MCFESTRLHLKSNNHYNITLHYNNEKKHHCINFALEQVHTECVTDLD